MQISDEALNEFIAIYKTEFGEEISRKDAGEMALRVLKLYELLERQLPDEKTTTPAATRPTDGPLGSDSELNFQLPYVLYNIDKFGIAIDPQGSNVLPNCPQFEKRYRFEGESKRLLGFNAHFFVSQHRVRTDDSENQPFCAVIAVAKPFDGSITE
jgi:hypothetical protein